MSTYREIHGRSIQAVTTDPTESVAEGQIWYNTTSDTFKSVVALESITAQGSLNTARYELAGAGSTTAGLVFGGQSTAITGATEEFNGSGFSNGGSLNQARQALGGAGTQTAGLGFGGYKTPGGSTNNSEEYDGSSWTAGNVIGTGRYRLMGIGIQTAALACAGKQGTGPSPGAVENTVEQYNGTSWTSGTNLSTARQAAGAAGTYTAGLICGGGATPTSPGGGTTNTGASEEWDGSSWTTGGTMPVTKRAFAGVNGLQTAAIMMGGAPNVTTVQTYDGTSWATSPVTLVTARHGGAGTMGQPGTTGLAIGGYDPGNTVASTEEYNKVANVITAAAWSSGGNLSTIGRYSGANAGTKNAALYAGGYSHPVPSPSYSNSTEEYNGSSWSSGGNLSNLGQGTGSAGLQTACWATGRTPNSSPTGPTVTTEEYDGSSWTAGGSLNTSQGGTSGCGTLTAGSYARGGQDHENYNGTAWTAATDSPSPARGGAKQAGTQTANIFFGGEIPGGTYINTTLEWDGSSWTTGGGMLINSAGYGGGIGTQTAAMQAQGYSPATSPNRMTQVSAYDGSSWSTRPSLSTGRSDGGNSSASPSTDAITFSGAVPPVTTATEEFTGETTALNVKTLTQS